MENIKVVGSLKEFNNIKRNAKKYVKIKEIVKKSDEEHNKESWEILKDV